MTKNPSIGQRNTRQREILQKVFAQAPGPLGIRRLLELSQTDAGKVGIATVYRTVRLLEEAKEIRPVSLPDGEIQWESAHRGHHHHFLCRTCSTVTDVPGCPVHVLPESLPAGFVLDGHELTLMGICDKCSPRTRSATRPRTRSNPRSN